LPREKTQRVRRRERNGDKWFEAASQEEKKPEKTETEPINRSERRQTG